MPCLALPCHASLPRNAASPQAPASPPHAVHCAAFRQQHGVVVAAADLAHRHPRQGAYQGGGGAVFEVTQPQRTILAPPLQRT